MQIAMRDQSPTLTHEDLLLRSPALRADTPHRHTPPPPCASMALSKHGVGVKPLFIGIFG